MSVLTPGFQPFGLSPRIEISDYDGVLQFTYEAEQVKAQRPIAAIDLNSRAIDLMGTNKGTWTGTEQYAKGNKQEKAGDFDGSSYITLLNEGNFDFDRTDPFSYVFLFKSTSTPTETLIAKRVAGIGQELRIQTTTNRFRFVFAGATQSTVVAWNIDTLRDGNWHVIILTKASGGGRISDFKFFVDGVVQTNLTVSDTLTSESTLNDLAVTIGARNDGTQIYTGQIEQVRIYNFELTQAQVTELNATTSPYGFVTKTTAAIQDFKLTDCSVNINGNGNMGNAVLLIEDHANALTDTTKRKRSKIQRMWDIQIFLGKDAGTMQRWFYGKTLETIVLRPGTNQQHLSIPCLGWSIVIKDRMTKMKRNQDKLSNGIDLDDADTKTRLDNLILDLFNKAEHQMDENLPKITSMSIISAETGICSDCLDIKVANINELGNSYAGFISRMASIANTDWYIDKDRQLVIRDADTHSSDFLFTNDLSGIDAQNWDKNKIAYIKNDILGWNDSSFDTMYSWLHGYGHFLPVKDSAEEATPNASDNLDDEFIAIPITPTRDDIFKIAVKMIRTGTPPSVLEIQIRGEDAASLGNPDPNDIRRTIKISKEFLATLGTTVPATFTEFPVKPRLQVVPDEQLFIVFPKYGDVSNTVNINYLSGSGTYRVSTDDIVWTSPTGKMAFREYSAKRLTTSLENTVLAKKLPEPREKLFPIRADLEEQSVRQALITASEILGKERRVYDKIKINAPTSPIPLASFCILQDSKTGLDVEARIITYKIEMHSSDETKIGANQIELTLDDIHSV